MYQGYFKPTLFDNSTKLDGRRKLIDRSYDLYDSSPNDPYSAAQADVLAAAGLLTQNKTTVSDYLTAIPTSNASNRQANNLLSRLNDSENTPRSSAPGSPAAESTPQPQRGTPAGTTEGAAAATVDPVIEAIKLAKERDSILPVMPLDAAIITSISQAGRGDDRKMRDFFGGIMVIGGGAKVPGFNSFLEQRLKEAQPGLHKEILIGPPPRELDPQVLVWKGGSVFGKLTATNDSWIGQMEYDRLGNRVLAYKCMWQW